MCVCVNLNVVRMHVVCGRECRNEGLCILRCVWDVEFEWSVMWRTGYMHPVMHCGICGLPGDRYDIFFDVTTPLHFLLC